MIDEQGYRPNVGIIICSSQGKVLWAKRIGQNAWQFPQGGIKDEESPEQALFRELKEEVGLEPQHVKIIGRTRGWLRYRLPKKMVRYGKRPICIGQKQKWFLLQLLVDDSHIDMAATTHPEFDGWSWVSYWYPLGGVVAFKRDVYRRAMAELAPYINKLQREVS